MNSVLYPVAYGLMEPMMTESRKAGRQPIRSSKAEERLNLRLTTEMRRQLDNDAAKIGIAPTELARRRIEAGETSAPTEPTDARVLLEIASLKTMMAEFAACGGKGVPLDLDDDSRAALEGVSRELGFHDPAHLMKALANKIVSDPDSIRGLLFDEQRDGTRARAEREFAKRNPKKD